MPALGWLPARPEFRDQLRRVDVLAEQAWPALSSLANTALGFVQTNVLDATLGKVLAQNGEPPAAATVRLAILGSSTLAHLQPAIRVAGLRRNIRISIYENEYGQYWQELTDPESPLHAFRPTMVLLALDAHDLAVGISASMARTDMEHSFLAAQDRIRACWRLARGAFQCSVIHQTPLPVHPQVLGNNEHRLAGSRAAFIQRLNAELRPMADEAGVDLLALDERAARDGLTAWHDPAIWHLAKQEVTPAAAPMYGDLVGRIVAARLGRSFKCLVLDLDNTLWGGVVGDDGLEGLVLGQGTALGEGFAAFQDYARELSRRGVILAVCSKNDRAVAMRAFETHPEMVLKPADIACFVANWNDKAANLRAIAAELAIGLDSLVFVDDNPFERNLVRQELPMVAVPEIGDDPALYAGILADAGYFEGVAVTEEDRARGAQYQQNRERKALEASATDLPGYLRGLAMQLVWRRFDQVGLGRIVQLINKTNQFNLTTRRYTEQDVQAVMVDASAFGLQLRLLDRFGDNGIVSIIIGRLQSDGDLLLDTWLMSCRVLGRQVEVTTLNLVVDQARQLGARRLVGEYIPTGRNEMVAEHYQRLGFTVEHRDPTGGSRAVLDLAGFTPADTTIDVREG